MSVKRTSRTRYENGSTIIDFMKEDGSVATSVTIEQAKIAKSVSGALMGYGAVALAQGSYSATDTPAEKAKAVQHVVQRLYDGEWEPGSRDSEAATPSIILALVEVLSKQKGHDQDADKVQAQYDAKTKSEKLKIAKNPDIVIARKRIEAERTKARLAIVKKEAGSEPLAF